MSDLPFVPYEDDEPYIFVSYAHADEDMVYPIITRLHEMGYHLWWDAGIGGGDDWAETIGQHLYDAAVMLLFLTPKSIASDFVLDEIHFARELKTKIVCVTFDTTELTHGLLLRLSRFQRIAYFSHNEAYFYKKLLESMSDKLGTAKKFTEEGIEYGIEDDAVTIKKYYGKIKDVVIPNVHEGKPVIEIKGHAFSGKYPVAHITIPASVIYIHENAFADAAHTYLHNLIIHCQHNSTAERYAKEHKIQYTDQEAP